MALYMVATPIGNLSDITLRALEVLRQVDYVLAEDTRKTRVLLKKYEIEKKIVSFNHHARDRQYTAVLNDLISSKSIAFVTDAGTPGISDPGNLLVSYIVGSESGDVVDIIPIPGPSALTAIISIAGFATDQFVFHGFLPKKGRERVLLEISQSPRVQIFLESPHRIVKVLAQLAEYVGDRDIVIGRELTKQFETIYRGTVAQVIEGADTRLGKGELIVALAAKKARK